MADRFFKLRSLLLAMFVVAVTGVASATVKDSSYSVLDSFRSLNSNESVVIATVVSIENSSVGRWPGPAVESPALVLRVEETLHGDPVLGLPVLGSDTFVFRYTCWHAQTKPRQPWILPGDRVLLLLEYLEGREASWVEHVFFLPTGVVTESTVLEEVSHSSMDWSSVDRCDENTSIEDMFGAISRTFSESKYSVGNIRAALLGD